MNYYRALIFSKLHQVEKIIFPLGLNIDVTKECNSECRHCYFRHQKYKNELSPEEWQERLKEIKKLMPQITSTDWIGGEPLLRPEIIEQGMKYFPINTVITNGTIKLPNWKNCLFLVSIDGTEKYYEQTRKKGIYKKIKNNINRDDVEVSINFTINKINADCIEAFLEEWSKTKIQNILFTFCTPIKGGGENLSLSWKKRDEIIDRLIKQRSHYKDLIMNPGEILELMKEKNAKEAIRNCVFRKRAFVSLDPNGRAKTPCSMGPNADCSKCGCIVPYFFSYFKDKEIILSPNYEKVFPQS